MFSCSTVTVIAEGIGSLVNNEGKAIGNIFLAVHVSIATNYQSLVSVATLCCNNIYYNIN